MLILNVRSTLKKSHHKINSTRKFIITNHFIAFFLNYVISNTGDAIVKTTLIVLMCLLPLSFSEFKSVSQLSLITMISAFVAVFFDLVYLPLIIKRLTN